MEVLGTCGRVVIAGRILLPVFCCRGMGGGALLLKTAGTEYRNAPGGSADHINKKISISDLGHRAIPGAGWAVRALYGQNNPRDPVFCPKNEIRGS
jgi:hypothetical protein